MAFLVLPDLRQAARVGTGEALTFLAVHQHADLMVRTSDGYVCTNSTDAAQLTGFDEKTASGHLARLAKEGLLVRQFIGVRRVGYRPSLRAEEFVTS